MESAAPPTPAVGSGAMALHQTGPIEPRVLRRVCGLFVTGVTVVTSGRHDRAAGTTVNSFTSVSLDPPLVLFCLHRNSRLRPLVQESGMFAVNFLAGRQESLAWAFAKSETALIDTVRHHWSGTGAPILSDALSFLVCRLADEIEGGDHTIFLGEVIELGVPRHDREPLIFFSGSMGTLEREPLPTHPIWDG